MRTSETHPLYVDFIEAENWRTPGRLGLTFAPGKHHQSPTGRWERDLDKDLSRLKDHWQTDLLVSLIEEHEFQSLRIPTLLTRAQDYAMNVLWFPIRDQSVPASMDEFDGIVSKINDELGNGRTVIIHCMAGLGRAGLVAASCLLALLRIAPQEAISTIRNSRSQAIQTAEQEAYVYAYYEYLSRRSHV